MQENAVQQAQPSRETIAMPRKLAFAVPLHTVQEKGFNYRGFVDAVKAEKRLTPEQQKHVIAAFNPNSRLIMTAATPVAGITSHVEAGASRALQDPLDMMQKGWDRESKQTLPDNHPIVEMWKDVWQNTLEHFAVEAVEYEQIMAAKGHSMRDDPTGFPAKAPPIYLMPKMKFVNAAAGISQEGTSEAMVTAGFLEKLSPEQQKAILYHEALHAFEPVLAGKTPAARMIGHALTSLATCNHTARQGEFRADEHAARMGMTDAMESAFNQMEKDQLMDYRHRAVVMNHLENSGFAVSADGVRNAMGAAAAAYDDMINGTGNAKTVRFIEDMKAQGFAEDELPPIEFVGRVKDGLENVGKKVLGKANDIMENIGENILQSQVNALNGRIADAAAYDRALQSGTHKHTHAAHDHEHGKSFRDRVGEVGDRVKEARRTHPKTSERIERMKHVERCKGCEDPSPFASHGDRVKAISKTGIQGIGAAR